MTPLNLNMIALLAIFSADSKVSAGDVNGSKVAEMMTSGDSLSTSYYHDIRERMDHLDDKICNTDKNVAVIQEKITSIDSNIETRMESLESNIESRMESLESNIESRMENLETKLENVGLKLRIEIRDQLTVYLEEMKTQLNSGRRENKDQPDLSSQVDQYHQHHNPLDIVGSLANMTNTMEALNTKVINKLEREVLAATTRLDDKLYSLSQKADVCLSAVIDNRNANCTDSVTEGLQGTPPSSWITILRRMDGRVNFTRGWEDYKSGFGDLGAEFWLGLEDIHQLTAVRSYRLRAVLTDFSGEVKFAEYSQFYIRGEADNYRLHVTGYVPGSTAGDSLAYHNNMDFSTFDRDNDRIDINCAANHKGGMWYNACHGVNPTGLYLGAGSTSANGVNWRAAYNDWRSFKRLEISIRQK